jgi:XRE family transcriptional regulator, regulator of sulfur utilization
MPVSSTKQLAAAKRSTGSTSKKLAVAPSADPSASEPAGLQLGAKLKAARHRKTLSLRALGESTGFSASFLSQVELEQVSPSLSSLSRICHALDVRLSDLLAEPAEPRGVVIRRRKGERLRSEWSRATVQALLPSAADERIEIVLVTLEPGGRSGKTPLVRTGKEFAFCARGRVSFTLDGAVHELAEGDSAFYDASLSRHWENTTKRRAEILLIALQASPSR